MGKRSWSKEDLIAAIFISSSVKETLERLNLNVSSGNYRTFYRYVNKWAIDTSHFGIVIGKSCNQKTKMSLNEILIENSQYTNTTTLKSRLIKASLLKYKCYLCGIKEWKNKPLSLQIDHVNGKSNDNRLKNLRLLCPNCHSQTSTYAGKRFLKWTCCECGNKISKKCKRCRKCSNKHKLLTGIQKTKISWPSLDVLKEMVAKSSFLQVAKELGVSDNAIRKRIVYQERRLKLMKESLK